MPELPVSVRVALWVSAAWRTGRATSSVWSSALADLDAVGGDVDVIDHWHSVGERALLVALPRSGDQSGLPACPPVSRLAAVDAGEALLAPGIGGLLVPTITRFGPEGQASSPDHGWRVDWRAHPADPVPVHVVTAIDLGTVRRSLAEGVLAATEALQVSGGPAVAHRAQPQRGASSRWALPDGIPAPVLELLLRAATIESACAEALASPADGLTADRTRGREAALRTLRDRAEDCLESCTNLAVAVLAGWRPA